METFLHLAGSSRYRRLRRYCLGLQHEPPDHQLASSRSGPCDAGRHRCAGIACPADPRSLRRGGRIFYQAARLHPGRPLLVFGWLANIRRRQCGKPGVHAGRSYFRHHHPCPRSFFFAALTSALYRSGNPANHRLRLRLDAVQDDETFRRGNLSTAANILSAGQRRPLLIKPHLATMTRSNCSPSWSGAWPTSPEA